MDNGRPHPTISFLWLDIISEKIVFFHVALKTSKCSSCTLWCSELKSAGTLNPLTPKANLG